MYTNDFSKTCRMVDITGYRTLHPLWNLPLWTPDTPSYSQVLVSHVVAVHKILQISWGPPTVSVMFQIKPTESFCQSVLMSAVQKVWVKDSIQDLSELQSDTDQVILSNGNQVKRIPNIWADDHDHEFDMEMAANEYQAITVSTAEVYTDLFCDCCLVDQCCSAGPPSVCECCCWVMNLWWTWWSRVELT